MVSPNFTTNENNKFCDSTAGDTAVRTCYGGAESGASPLPVIVENKTATSLCISEFNEKAIASTITDTIVSYTVPSGKELELDFIEFGGSNIAIYSVEIASATEAKKRTWWAGDLNGDFPFSKMVVDENTLVELKVENYRPTTGNFEGRIVGVIDDK